MPGPYLKYCATVEAIFIDRFSRHFSLSDSWETISPCEVLTLKEGLRFTYPGEVLCKDSNLLADQAVGIKFSNVPELILEIRCRRSDANNYVCFGLNFETKKVYIAKVESGTRTVLKEQDHDLSTDPILYQMYFWVYGDSLMGFVNGSYIIDATSSFNQTETEFSLFTPAIWENIITQIDLVMVHSLELYPSTPTIPDDPTNMYQQFRIQLKDIIENPPDLSYEHFMEARKGWERGRNLGYKDDVWGRWGYPIYEPLPEEWFKKA